VSIYCRLQVSYYRTSFETSDHDLESIVNGGNIQRTDLGLFLFHYSQGQGQGQCKSKSSTNLIVFVQEFKISQGKMCFSHVRIRHEKTVYPNPSQ